MPDVFLSYSSKDRQAAERVQQALAARGIDVFWDQETPAGQDWDTWIRGKLNACKVAVVLWSRASVKSDNVRHEALVARKAEKLLPAMIDPIAAEDLPMGLYMVQTVNLTDWRSADSKGVAKLVEEIATRVGKRAAPAASAPAAKAAGGGMSPKAQTAVALIGIAAVVAGVAWFMMQQQTPTLPSDRISGNEVFTPGDGAGATTPGATCLDGSVPTLGVCANGQRPIPPAPVLGPVSEGTTEQEQGARGLFDSSIPPSRRIVGSWYWTGVSCREGAKITLESGRLVFTTPTNRYVHAIESEDEWEIRTRITDCTGCSTDELNNKYLLSAYVRPSAYPVGATDSGGAYADLWIDNVTRGTRDTWSPCEVR